MQPSYRIETREIPFENVDAVPALLAGQDGKIYVGLQCVRAHYLLASYDPGSDRFEDCRLPYRADKIHSPLVLSRSGKFYGGTWNYIRVQENDCRYSDLVGGNLFRFDPADGTTTDLGQPFDHEQIDALALDPLEEKLYGLSFPMKRFFSVDLQTGVVDDIVELKGPIGGPTTHRLACDNEGNVWGSQADGTVFCYEAAKRTFHETSIRLPEGEYQIDSIVTDVRANLLYGGTIQNGILFVLDPSRKKLRPIAKAAATTARMWRKRNVRLGALAIDEQGRLFGSTGSLEARYFRYEPDTDLLVDFGPIVDSETGIDAHRIHSMAIGRDGSLYFAESDRHHRPYIYICKPTD